MSDEVKRMLLELRRLRDEIARLERERQERIGQIVAPVADLLAAVDREMLPEISRLGEEAELLEAEIKQRVLELRESVVSHEAGLQAIMVTRTSWDSRKLEGLALVFTEIGQCRQVTEYVQIREVKG